MTASTWRYAYIDNPQEALSASGKMREQVLAAVLAGATSAAIFSRIDPEHGGTHFYFNAAAGAVASAHRATPCPPPTLKQAGGLLAGNASVKDELAK